jgi:segregation and condensation protein B
VEVSQLAKALEISPKMVAVGLERLEILYRQEERGLRMITLDGRRQLVTLPAAAGAIEDFLNLDLTTRLSGPALETLAVIAYRQPVTRVQVESVRGVDCSGVLRSLLQRGLIEEAGRLETVGRPILYGVTDLFMQHFGLTALNELPELELEDADTLWAATELLDGPEALDAETTAQLTDMQNEAADKLSTTDDMDDAAGETDTEINGNVEVIDADIDGETGAGHVEDPDGQPDDHGLGLDVDGDNRVDDEAGR